MSAYSEASKRVGWGSRTVRYPSAEEFNRLVVMAENDDIHAFTRIFELYRFLPSPTSKEEVDRMNEIVSEFNRLSKKYKSL